ncbi:3-isopropylmalate dehydratase small subunit [Virgibacillus oceani]
MEAIESHKGSVYPLDRSNVDTDQIIPKQFLKRIERTGFGQFLFYHWRFDDDGKLRDTFSLNEEKYKDATILLGGENFGCGSSREHAPWAILDYGFKVIIAPSFADIFHNNAMKNGLLLVQMNEKQMKQWMRRAENAALELQIDLKKQTITDENGHEVSFEIPEFHKQKLLNGWDDISLTLHHEARIEAYENEINL